MTFSVYMNMFKTYSPCIYLKKKRKTLDFQNFEIVNIWFVIFRANWGLGWFLSDSGDEVSMCHFKKTDFWLKNIFRGECGVLK